ncbi:MAG: hypothetical protein AB8B74_01570 [Crocinitomicaceae bacterium]
MLLNVFKRVNINLALLFCFHGTLFTLYAGNNKSELKGLVEKASTIFIFEEELNLLRHDFSPWKKTSYQLNGEFWQTNSQFNKFDTLTTASGKQYRSEVTIGRNVFLRKTYGKSELTKVTQREYENQLVNTARYTPNYLEQYFKSQKEIRYWDNEKYMVSKLEIGDYTVNIFKSRKTDIIERITALSHDDLYGDVTTTYRYSSYVTKYTITYPSKIRIEKINGKVIDNVTIAGIYRKGEMEPLISKPNDYQFEIVELPLKKLIVSKYNEHIYLIDLVHTDDKVLVVEFDDFLLVAEAPISSENGELIIAEIKKSISNKPIKYFIFGHHHPHYLGGIRAFIHQEATILCETSNLEYVKFIAEAKHTLKPDSLEVNPKPLVTEIIKDSLTIGNKYPMKIYWIGEKSKHTSDYLIYYFPSDKLLFQDDLCWIPNDGPLKKARERQAGLYLSIIDLNIEVDTIIQSWPVGEFGVKTIFPFKDLESSVQMKE